MPFSFKKLTIPGLVLIEPEVLMDGRGFFMEVYKASVYEKFGIDKPFVQVNQSYSKKGILRGLHFQKEPKPQGKLVSVVHGEIFDVAVDMRRRSDFYGKWHSEILSSENKNLFYIPEGFAHGFVVLSDFAEVVYYCTEEYSPEHDAGIIWNDKQLSIDWPIKSPLLSEKDARLPAFEKIQAIAYRKIKL
ncbi:MAG: dTDP-4-dehydrorhamnose 3,5-epimerase [Candidatus Omnitrophica bacterium]|nr:dTDP-4-dehydrorhamnose 3,5-epimerase [Candidatus Omnitrophota bacterium]